MGDDYYRVESQKRQNKAAAKMLKYKHDHRQSFTSSGEDCRCGNGHKSINILDDKNGMSVIEHNVCPFMYFVRNVCLRAIFGKHIPEIDSKTLQDVSRGN